MLRLVGPLHLVSADQCAPQLEESLADVGPPLIAYLQPPVADQPRQSPPTKSSPPPMPTQLSMPQVSEKNSSRKPAQPRSYSTPQDLPDRPAVAVVYVGKHLVVVYESAVMKELRVTL